MHQGQWLKEEIQRQKQTVSGFARAVGVSRSQLHEWFTQDHLTMRADLMWAVLDALGYAAAVSNLGYQRDQRPGLVTADKLARASYVSAVFDELQIEKARRGLQPDRDAPGHASVREFEPGSARLLADIPIFELSLSAGPWSDVLDVPAIYSPESLLQGLFRVRLAGDSMSPKYQSGMIIEFECLRPGVDNVLVGRDYYVQRDDGAATFKRVEHVAEDTVTLRALNVKKYPTAFIVERERIVRMAIARGEYKPFE